MAKKYKFDWKIIFGIIFFILLILFGRSLISNSVSNYDPNPECSYDEVLGEDNLCHKTCGAGYCGGDDVCYNGNCYEYPYEAISCMKIYANKLGEFPNVSGEASYKESYSKYVEYSKKFNELNAISNLCYNYVRKHREALTSMGWDVDTILLEMNNVYHETKNFLDEWGDNLQNPCQQGYVIGDDDLCHKTCGDPYHYCSESSTCCNNECVSCSVGSYLGTDCKCYLNQ